MNVLLVTYFAPLAAPRAGGVQQWVHHILPRLVARGLRLTVLCPGPAEGPLLEAGPALRIVPALREARRRPLRADEVRWNHEVLARHASDAGVVWVVDRHLPIRVAPPVVLSWTTVAYQTELEGLALGNWDVVVTPSPYLARVALAIAGPDRGPQRCVHVPIDTARFRRQAPPDPSPAGGAPYLFFPHRPDPGKGFDVALDVMRELARAGAPHRLLVPSAPASATRAVRGRDHRRVRRMRGSTGAAGLADRVVFYPWAPPAEMPGLYSGAEWTLALSRLPEGFMLSPFESIACGTPVIATPSGAVPEVLPAGHGLELVGGFRDAPAIAARILAGPPPRAQAARGARYVASHYDVEAAADAYVAILTSARKRPAGVRAPVDGRLVVSPWCRRLGPAELWHDLRMRAIRLSAAERACLGGLRPGEAAGGGPELEPVRRRLLEAGVLVPASSPA